MFLTTTFFTITDENIATMLGYTKDLITDLTPILLPIVAIGLGLIIFYAVVKAIRG